MQVPEVRADAANAKRKVAVVGAGPSGLSCAYFMARLGYRPTVFEAEKKAGGMLVQTIPSYRLPREVLAKEVDMIRKLGVKLVTGRKLGRDFTLKSLREQGYEAVYLGLGAGSVTVLYRRTREEMPAWEEEVEEAVREGVKFEFLVAPREIEVRDGKAVGVKCTRMDLGEFDRSGRRRPKEKAGSEFVVDADLVVGAIGQKLDPSEFVDGTAVKLTDGEFVMADPLSGQTSVEWLFSGGDAATGPSSVVAAIAGGERGAVGIDRYLTGATHAFWREEKAIDTAFDPEAEPVVQARAPVETLAVGKRVRGFQEVEKSWGAPVAIREARRCLRCDYREACK